MSLFDPSFDAGNSASCLDPSEEAAPGDRHQRLLEAGTFSGCDIDLLSLMPSLDRPELPWIDGRGWPARILGF